MKNKIPIAKIGKTHGLKGWVKLHLLTDFPEQFQKNRNFDSDKGELRIEQINPKNNTIKFYNFDTPECARKLTNCLLYSDENSSKEHITLKKDEWFWFDIIGCEVVENGIKLGEVEDISRINDIDYVVVRVDLGIDIPNKPKRFLFDFKRHIIDVDITNKKLTTKNTIPILETS